MIPANLLPMLSIKVLGKTQEGTLWTGIGAMFKEDLWPLGTLVMLSSVLLPAANMMLGCLISFYLFNAMPNPRLAVWMRAYQHLYEWAMIEVYALGIIVACVKLSDMADIKFGFGLYGFIGLLLINALLANEFDSHTFWRRIAALSQPPNR